MHEEGHKKVMATGRTATTGLSCELSQARRDNPIAPTSLLQPAGTTGAAMVMGPMIRPLPSGTYVSTMATPPAATARLTATAFASCVADSHLPPLTSWGYRRPFPPCPRGATPLADDDDHDGRLDAATPGLSAPSVGLRNLTQSKLEAVRCGQTNPSIRGRTCTAIATSASGVRVWTGRNQT